LKTRIAFIGVGNMAGAILGGIVAAGSFSPSNITLFDKNASQYEKYAEYPFTIASTAAEAVKAADYIVLAVKPQNYRDVLCEIKDAGISTDGKVFISLAAGISTDTIEKCLGCRAAIVRTMPNTPMLVGFGVTALCPNDLVSDEDFETVRSLFASRGTAFILSEDKMNSVISVTGSSPAYIYKMIEALYEGAIAEGMDESGMLDIICDTVIGSAQMVKTSGKTPSELIRMGTSPKGTTEKAMIALEEHGFSDGIKDAMHRCTLRAEELAKEFSDSI